MLVPQYHNQNNIIHCQAAAADEAPADEAAAAKAFAKRFKQRREKSDVTLRKVAAILGCSPSTVSRFENQILKDNIMVKWWPKIERAGRILGIEVGQEQ